MKNSAVQLYCWQEQKIRMGSCKVIFLKRHWEIWWCHWRKAITGWDSCWKSHPYRKSSDWGLNIFPSLYILFLLDLFSNKNDFLIFDIIILANLADNFKRLNLKCCGYMAGDRSRLPAIQKFRYAVVYYWQEQKIRMGSCKVILLKRHWEIWWYHRRNAIRGWDLFSKSHPYRESSDWGLNNFFQVSTYYFSLISSQVRWLFTFWHHYIS